MTRACFVSASGQNVFFEELAEALREALEAAGVATETAVDRFPPVQDDLAFVFFPHEYLPLTMAAAHPDPAQLARSVVMSSEQPGTTWFREVAKLAPEAGATIDLHPLGAEEHRRRGVDVDLLTLGYVPSWDHWGGDESSERPIDVTFMGGYSERRGEALAGCGSVLAGRRAAIHLYETDVPHTADSPHYFAGERKWRHLAASKLLLNVHRDKLGYFEWQRAIGALSNGCVLVTEHSLGVEPLVPGEHFLSADCGSLPAILDSLLDDESRVRELRQAGYAAVRERPLAATIHVLAEAVERAAAASTDIFGGVSGFEQVALPKDPPGARPAEPLRLANTRGALDPMRAAVKQVLLGQRDLRRRLDRLERAGEKGEDAVERFGDSEAVPRVSVVIPVFNHEELVGGAIESAALSDYRDLEVVVVDDGSTDGSLEAARAAIERSPWLRGTLVSAAENRGLPAARNLAVSHSEGEFVFMLDADNAVYPHALGRLVSALDDHPGAAMAYGVLEVVEATGRRDLRNWLPWSPSRFRYGNYVDAMALIRRGALEEIGGYTTDPRVYGWEDFALWCEFAHRSWTAVHVPEILARYRRGLHSMIAISDLSASEAWDWLLGRYPFLAETA
jgi:hypothetical protein